MEWTGLNELRQKYLSFFESKGHRRLPSFPLVPQDDPTLLLINAGMAPMKKFFLGQVKPPASRVVTCQKCVRTADIERVGKTARHGTYFEMLGNFSFGDYFKHEATAYAWEFITKVLKLPVDKLWVTIYTDDDEAFDIWTKEVGVDPSHIARLGREENFWEHGSLPCGPCSEIYFDRGEKYGCGRPECAVGCDCDRYTEFWNIVFQQFASDGKGNYTPLKKPNIDTGMGLERLACILQGVDSMFDIDTMQNIMSKVSEAAGVKYGKIAKHDVSLRIITDHIRSTVFLAADGVMPSNEGRGYVLRRLLRRAARHGRLLGIDGSFLTPLCDTVIEDNRGAYPELAEKAEYIKTVVKNEEERFSATIDQGLGLLSEMADGLEKRGGKVLPGADAFKLYDTYGFPLDLTREILEERSIGLDEEGFDRLMLEQRERARAARSVTGTYSGENVHDVPPTAFIGYGKYECETSVAAIVKDGVQKGTAGTGEHAEIYLEATPFYAESGGQVGDTGVITTDTAVVRVNGCVKTPTGRYIHRGEVISGSINTGDRATAKIDITRRSAVTRNHSAAHLLQSALRRVLGGHVRQAGQLVDEHRVRFDFTHFNALTADELTRVEQEVNTAILDSLDVTTTEMPIEEAKKTGAMALFDEKYGDTVRVVEMGGSQAPVSMEFCGGTHVSNTSQIGLFAVESETSAAAGVRRIEGVTGLNVLELLKLRSAELSEAAKVLKAPAGEIADRAKQLAAGLREKEHELEKLHSKIAGMRIDRLLADAKSAGGFKVVTALFNGENTDSLRLMTDRLKDAEPLSVTVLAGINGGKLTFAAACGSEAVAKGAHAGNLVRAVAKLAGGSGGGRPESATAGGKDLSKAKEALEAVPGLLAQ